MAYTPGVARVRMEIARDEAVSHEYTIRKNTVAIVSDGTAVLGLGDIGPYAAMSVVEGKAMLFETFGVVDAFTICVKTSSVDEIVDLVCRLERGHRVDHRRGGNEAELGGKPTFGGINLEDIAAPCACEVEERLINLLDIPVFHDDQHGTASRTRSCSVSARSSRDSAVLVVSGHPL